MQNHKSVKLETFSKELTEFVKASAPVFIAMHSLKSPTLNLAIQVYH